MPPHAVYERQYFGIVRGGRRLIYGNFFPARVEGQSGFGRTAMARVVCDGGSSFWGVVFDPKRNTFTDWAFNGP